MRAKEFIKEDQGTTISIPITINIPAGGGVPTVSTVPTAQELPPHPVMVTPPQQELELAKAQAGKESLVINQITADHGAYGDHSQENPNLISGQEAPLGAGNEHADFITTLKKLLSISQSTSSGV
jgi:glucose/arabinose dehydrogenase